MFTCRTCHVSEPATSSCVFQNTLNSQVGDTAGVTTDVGSDPTVGAPVFCTMCGGEIVCIACGDFLVCSEEESLESLGLEDIEAYDYSDDYDEEEDTSENNPENTKSS